MSPKKKEERWIKPNQTLNKRRSLTWYPRLGNGETFDWLEELLISSFGACEATERISCPCLLCGTKREDYLGRKGLGEA